MILHQTAIVRKTADAPGASRGGCSGQIGEALGPLQGAPMDRARGHTATARPVRRPGSLWAVGAPTRCAGGSVAGAGGRCCPAATRLTKTRPGARPPERMAWLLWTAEQQTARLMSR